MTLTRFNAMPRKGHLGRINRVYGYLAKMRLATIRVRTELPDVSDLNVIQQDWSRTVHADYKEEIPHDNTSPTGKKR